MQLPMNIAITTQIFPPERHPTGVMVDELARDLTMRGHHVSVITGFPHHPHGKVLGSYTKTRLLVEERAGVKVVRAWHLTSENMWIGARAAVMASQALSTMLGAASLGRMDVVLNFGPPLLGPVFSAALARRWAAPLISVIHDLYPDVAVETGTLSNPLVIGPARLLERLTYRTSDKLIVLSEGFKRALLRKGVDKEKLEIIPVWLAPDEIKPLCRGNSWRRENDIPLDKQIVLYAGTIGLVSGAQIILDVAAALCDKEDILFLIVGEGRVKDVLEREAQVRKLPNMKFIGFQPRERLAEVQATADVSLVTLAPGRGYTSVPSKVIGYMAAGRPIAASVDLDCDTADAIRSAGCGVVVGPGNADGLATELMLLLANEPRRRELGRASRAAFLRHFSSESALPAYHNLIRSVVGQSAQRHG
jgi:colanic acid biosynthesis glycosyl transferase WcaI